MILKLMLFLSVPLLVAGVLIGLLIWLIANRRYKKKNKVLLDRISFNQDHEKALEILAERNEKI